MKTRSKQDCLTTMGNWELEYRDKLISIEEAVGKVESDTDVIVACFFTVSIAYGIRYAYGMLLPELLPALGISKTAAGMIFSIYFIVFTLANPILGGISDLFNYRLVIFLFTAVLAAGAFLMARAGGFSQACVIFSVAGLGHAVCWAPVAALVSKWVPDHKRGTALSFVTISDVSLLSVFLRERQKCIRCRICCG